MATTTLKDQLKEKDKEILSLRSQLEQQSGKKSRRNRDIGPDVSIHRARHLHQRNSSADCDDDGRNDGVEDLLPDASR